MESFENQRENSKSAENEIIRLIYQNGIGHMSKETTFSFDRINQSERKEVIETYNQNVENINSFLGLLKEIIEESNTENRSPEVFDDLLNGISEALYKTLNQILYHASVNPRESLTAFDEFAMVLKSVNHSLNSPEIINKKKYRASSIYILSPLGDVEGFEIKSFDTLFSKDHIAFNLTSNPLYQNTEKVVKSGIRLDYGPLYKETEKGIDKSKTEWITSVDISGYYIDKIMNLYSPRGHHFTKVFKHKINLLMKSFAEHMEQHFDGV